MESYNNIPIKAAAQAKSGVSIVIPTWNGKELLAKFLPTVVKALAEFEEHYGLKTEIIVTDDASNDGTEQWIEKAYPDINFITGVQRLGFSGNSNRGIEAAQYRLVYLLNNDVAINSDTLPPLLKHFTDDNVFAVASQVYDFETGILSGAGQIGQFRRGYLRIHDRYFVEPEVEEPDMPYLTIYATGGSAMYDREKFLAIGGFDTLYSPYGWEDVEVSIRAWRLGYTVHYEPKSPVWHQFSSTIGQKIPKKSVNVIYERNRIMAHWIHLGLNMLLEHIVFLFINLPRHIITGKWEYAKAIAESFKRINYIIKMRKAYNGKSVRSLDEIVKKILSSKTGSNVQILNAKTAISKAVHI